jgi:hypothetical protein
MGWSQPTDLLGQIRAPQRVVPRYAPERRFPPYRYVPGLYPQPVRDPAGHSYDPRPQVRRHVSWDPLSWRALSDWKWGVDLFNAFYFWEAHEAWEGLWAVKPRTSAPATTLQGLIQVAAALLKVHLRSVAGASRLSDDGLTKLEGTAATAPVQLGLDVAATAIAFRTYFRPLAQRTLPPLDASVPVLRLAEEAT